MAVAVLVVISFLPYKLTLIETGRLDENIFIRCMTPLPISLFLFFFPPRWWWWLQLTLDGGWLGDG